MKHLTKSVIWIFLVLYLSGCTYGNFSGVYRRFSIDDGTGALIDIKQRAILSTRSPDKNGREYTVVCAEPSPDAISAIATETSISVPEKIQFASALQESAAFNGLRTQSIQLLRDGMYRLCESYLNSVISNFDYKLQMRRYQRNMVAILAIEQLTGTVRAPAVAVYTEGSAQAARDIESLQNSVKKIDDEIALRTKEKVEAEKNNKPESVTQLTEEITGLQEQKEIYKQAITNSASLVASGKSNVDIQVQQIMPPSSIASVASAVNDITTFVLNTDETLPLCFEYLSNDDRSKELSRYCEGALTDYKNMRIKQAEHDIARETWLMNNCKTPDCVAKITERISKGSDFGLQSAF